MHGGLTAAVFMPRIVYLGIAVIAASAVYVILLTVFKIDEVKMLKGMWR